MGYLRRRLSGEVIDFVELDMPEHTLATTAVMYTITPDALRDNGIEPPRVPGSLHAAEHAAIGLLPLVASCDRGDIGGVSTAVGPDPVVCRRSSSTTAIRAARDSPNAAFARPAPGWALQPPPSKHANAPGDARRACSPPSAATATTRSTRRVRCGCCDWSWRNWVAVELSDPADGDRPLDGRPPRFCPCDPRPGTHFLLLKKCRRAITSDGQRSDNASPFINPDDAGAGNYQGSAGMCNFSG